MYALREYTVLSAILTDNRIEQYLTAPGLKFHYTLD